MARSKSNKLTPKQERFVREYMKDLNATQAAKRAGYSELSAFSQGIRLTKNAIVKRKIAALIKKEADKQELSAEWVIDRLMQIGDTNAAELFDAQGNLRPIRSLPLKLQKAIASVKVIKKNLAAGDGHADEIHEVKFWDKPKSLEMLGRRLALFHDPLELDLRIRVSADEIMERLLEGRRRNALPEDVRKTLPAGEPQVIEVKAMSEKELVRAENK